MRTEIWKQENEEIRERYELSMERVQAMGRERSVAAPFYDYFHKTAAFIERMGELAKAAGKENFSEISLEELQKQNRELYADVAGEEYKESYACLETAVRRLGEGYGQILSFLYRSEERRVGKECL